MIKMKDALKTTQKKRVLIVEDDPVHRRLMASELQQRYELDQMVDSESALACLQGNTSSAYDLVIVNLRLPARVGKPAKTEEGLRVIETLYNNCPSLPVIVVAGSLVDSIRTQIEALGVRMIFEKPFSLKTFRESIDTLLTSPLNSGN